MIAFNHNIIFDELTLNSIYNDKLSTIFVKEETLSSSFVFSGWVDMNGRDIRYYRSVDNNSWGLEIRGLFILIWDTHKKEIRYIKKNNYTKKSLFYWVLHTFLPMVLQLERTFTILHVGCVEVNKEAILFLAPSFGGKSTLVSYFLNARHHILSDDTLGIDIVDKKYYAISSYPFYRPYREVESLGIEIKNFTTTPKPIHYIYILQKSPPNASIEIVEIFGIEKFKALHFSLFIDFANIKEDSFEFLMKLSNHIPIYKITIPWDLDRLDEVYQSIIKKTKESSL